MFGLSACLKFSGSSGLTKVVSMPSFFRFTPSSVCVPPYSVEADTTWSPALHSVRMAVASAAWPVAQASAARPPSSAATRSSSTATVGFEMRE